MKTCFVIIICILIACLWSCGVVRTSPKYQLANGYYKSKTFSSGSKKVYVDNEVDTIYVYSCNQQTKDVDTSSKTGIIFPERVSKIIANSRSFRQASFDVDFVSMPFKYRPTQRGFPQQFNTQLNGAVYLGFRNDVYQVKYKKSPLKKYDRQTTHYGFSFGMFSGIGGSAINPWVTNYVVGYEYDGVVWAKGVGAFIGINNFNIGLALGFDYLMDNNRDFWIYQNKPWLGLAFGLNLN